MTMNAALKLTVDDVRQRVSKEEWDVRVKLAACYRLVAHYGWDDLVYTHISARVPGPEHHFLINPYGVMFEEVTASSLVKVDIDGNVVLDNGYAINPAGYTIHSAIHAARENAGCVLLVEDTPGVARLRLLVVEPGARGLGLGAKLTDECVRFAREAGYSRITLWTHSNLTAARHIYQKAGFTLTRSEPHQSWGQPVISEHWDLVL